MAIEFYKTIRKELEALGFEITTEDLERPWGAFYYIHESQAQSFSSCTPKIHKTAFTLSVVVEIYF